MVDAWDETDDTRRIGSRAHTVGELFTTEQPLLAPLPNEPFETGRWFTPRVDRYVQITVRMNKYSVPTRMVGRQARVLLNASDLIVFDAKTEIARHERLMTKGATRVDLDHYLEVLLRKPGALPGATALDQARASGRFTPVHDAWWAAACKAHGDADGTRALIEVTATCHTNTSSPDSPQRSQRARSPQTPSHWKRASTTTKQTANLRHDNGSPNQGAVNLGSRRRRRAVADRAPAPCPPARRRSAAAEHGQVRPAAAQSP
ncbi:hypothetical protein GCM10027425_06240 [Alteromonas gracilis]